MTLKAAAAAFSVAPATAHRWWHRWRAASAEERHSRSCLRDRSSRPRRSPRRLTAAEEEPILRARRETNLARSGTPAAHAARHRLIVYDQGDFVPGIVIALAPLWVMPLDVALVGLALVVAVHLAIKRDRPRDRRPRDSDLRLSRRASPRGA